ncbi:MAG: hypothetical protein ABEJ86_05550 [Halococcoides sp.]
MSDEADRVAELSALLDEKNARIAQLESDLEDARRLNRLAEQFVDAASEHLASDSSGSDPPATPEWPDWTRVDESDDASTDATSGASTDVDTLDSTTGSTNGGTAPATEDNDDGAFDLLGEDACLAGGGSDPASAEGPDSSQRRDAGSDLATDGRGDALTEALAGLDAIESPDPRNDELAALYETIDDLDAVPLAMLDYYHREGPATPIEAYEAIAGGGDRTAAYAANRELRSETLVDHVGQGRYDTRFEALVVDRIGGDPATIEDCRSALVDHLERAVETPTPT